jgi:hypothetical protein
MTHEILHQREQDHVIMDIFFASDLGPEIIKSLSRCRGAMRAIFLSDLSTADGKYLKHFVFHPGKATAGSMYIDRNCDVLPLSLDDLLDYTTLMLKFCTNKPIWASLLRQVFFWWGGRERFAQKRV